MATNQQKFRSLNMKLEAISKRLSSKMAVTVGIQKGTGMHEESQTTVASIAAANEFGVPSKGIPERSFMRSTVHEKNAEYKEMVKTLSKKVVKGKIKQEEMMGLLGQQVEADIKKKIQDTYTPPNKPETIKRKESDHPLIDKGQMINSIRYKVEKASD